jgi:hypothetical protein
MHAFNLMYNVHIHVHVPDFRFLYECYLDRIEGLEQATNFVYTEVLGKLKSQNLRKKFSVSSSTDESVKHSHLVPPHSLCSSHPHNYQDSKLKKVKQN